MHTVGTAKGIVVATGDGTFIGRIAGLTSGMDKIDTPMSREVSRFIKIISGVAVFFGVTFFIVSLSMGYPIIDAALFLIGIIVANVPEGLLVTFTVILALTAKRMASKNCLVRQLHAVETLGSCSVICSDKTGTLTQNKMTASHMWFSNRIVEASPDAKEFDPKDKGFEALARVAALCSRAKFLSDQENLPVQDRIINGDASESAILRNMEMHLGGAEKYQNQRKKVFEVPFNSSNKWQLSVHELSDDPRYLMVMKVSKEKLKEKDYV
jgi:magnesium-transporting ATPase (P-type)